MRPHIDWLAGFAITVAWAATVWLASLAVEWREAGVWVAFGFQAVFTAAVTAMVIYMKRYFMMGAFDHPERFRHCTCGHVVGRHPPFWGGGCTIPYCRCRRFEKCFVESDVLDAQTSEQ